MIERLVENWLDNTGERGFETPFAQMLTLEGHRVLQGPVHHPFEHGKDIITLDRHGNACAFQLKGPRQMGLKEFEDIHGQLLALVTTAVSHGAIGNPRLPDRVHLVTNGILTAPARDRVQQFNAGNAPLGFPRVEVVERENLLGRFLRAHGSYLPQNLSDIRALLELYYADASTLFPVCSFAAYLTEVMPFPPATPSNAARRSAVASAALLTAYAAHRWTQAENYLCTAQAWLTFCVTVLRFAEVHQIEAAEWMSSYELAMDAGRAALASLAKEAAEAPDLVVSDVTEGFFYSSRALLVCGFLSAYWFSERTRGPVDEAITESVRRVLVRERDYGICRGECEVPAFFEWSCALGELGDVLTPEGRLIELAASLARTNKRHSPVAMPDPYHDVEEVLMRLMGDPDSGDEEFDGNSYMLHVIVDRIARRLWRQALAGVWPEITRIQLMEFRPSAPERYLAPRDDDGKLFRWFAEPRQSWKVLLASARTKDYRKLPGVLLRQREMIPYLPLLFPFRFTATLAAAVEAISSKPLEPL